VDKRHPLADGDAAKTAIDLWQTMVDNHFYLLVSLAHDRS